MTKTLVQKKKTKNKKNKIEEFVAILKKMPDVRPTFIEKIYPNELQPHIIKVVAEKILDEQI